MSPVSQYPSEPGSVRCLTRVHTRVHGERQVTQGIRLRLIQA